MIKTNVGTVAFKDFKLTAVETVRFTTDGTIIVELTLNGKGVHKDVVAHYDVATMDAANRTLQETCVALMLVDTVEETLTKHLDGCTYNLNGKRATNDALNYFAQLDATADTIGWHRWDDLMLLN